MRHPPEGAHPHHYQDRPGQDYRKSHYRRNDFIMATLEKFRDLRTQAIHENLERRGIKNNGDRDMVSTYSFSHTFSKQFLPVKVNIWVLET